ncbi:MAG: sulfotransferase [Thermoanaerobaculia bacterium]
MSSPELPRVIYIAGAGRSGSTVLDTLLGALPGAASLGELAKLLRHAYLEDHYCACGERGRSCPFWSEVRRRAFPAAGPVELEEIERQALFFERLRSLPRLLAERREPGPEFARYAERTTALLRAIAATAGCRLVVDSSKHPLRALALSLVPGLDLTLVHLVRDPRAVAWSYLKAFARDEAAGVEQDIAPQAAWRTALGWSLTNLAAEWVARQLPRGQSVTVRYEELVSSPAATLERIGRAARADVGVVVDRVRRGEAFAVGHTIAGNRLRRSGAVALKPDWSWQGRLSRGARAAVLAFSGPLLPRYSYEFRSPRPSPPLRGEE